MTDKRTSVSAIVGFVLAILALLLSAIPIVNNFAFVLAIIGLIFGIVASVGVRKGKVTGKRLAIATIIISVLACGIVLISQQIYGNALDKVGKDIDNSFDMSSGKKTDEILGKHVDVKIGKLQVKTGEFGTESTALPVKVTNNLSETKTFELKIEVVDSKGNRIADDTVYASDLKAKQSQSFKAFEYIDDAKLGAVQKGKFKVLSVSEY